MREYRCNSITSCQSEAIVDNTRMKMIPIFQKNGIVGQKCKDYERDEDDKRQPAYRLMYDSRKAEQKAGGQHAQHQWYTQDDEYCLEEFAGSTLISCISSQVGP